MTGGTCRGWLSLGVLLSAGSPAKLLAAGAGVLEGPRRSWCVCCCPCRGLAVASCSGWTWRTLPWMLPVAVRLCMVLLLSEWPTLDFAPTAECRDVCCNAAVVWLCRKDVQDLNVW